MLRIYGLEGFPKTTKPSPNAFLSSSLSFNPLSFLPRCSPPPPLPPYVLFSLFSLSPSLPFFPPLSSPDFILSSSFLSKAQTHSPKTKPPGFNSVMRLSRHVYFEHHACLTMSFRRKWSNAKLTSRKPTKCEAGLSQPLGNNNKVTSKDPHPGIPSNYKQQIPTNLRTVSPF